MSGLRGGPTSVVAATRPDSAELATARSMHSRSPTTSNTENEERTRLGDHDVSSTARDDLSLFGTVGLRF